MSVPYKPPEPLLHRATRPTYIQPTYIQPTYAQPTYAQRRRLIECAIDALHH